MIKAWLRNAFKRRKAAERFSEFKALVTDNADLGSKTAGSSFTLTWPGNGIVGISGSITLAAGKVTVNGVTLGGAANALLHGPYVSEGKTLTIVTLNTLAACTLSVYVLNEWEQATLVATATVT